MRAEARRRFELSEEDRALLQGVHEAVQRQGARAEGDHTATLVMMQSMERRLGLRMDELQRELQATSSRGAEAVDLDAKEQLFMEQIASLLAQTSISPGSTGETLVPCRRSFDAKSARSSCKRWSTSADFALLAEGERGTGEPSHAAQSRAQELVDGVQGRRAACRGRPWTHPEDACGCWADQAAAVPAGPGRRRNRRAR